MEKSKLGAKLFVIIVIIVFLASTFTVMFYNPNSEEKQKTIKYKDLEFTHDPLNNVYHLRNSDFVLIADPAQTESIQSTFDSALVKDAQKVYISFSPNAENLDFVERAAQQVAEVSQFLGKKAIITYTEDASPINPSVPIKTCSDASKSAPVIVIQNGESKISQELDCIIVQGSKQQIEVAAARLALDLLE